jgi:hypothetical protein
MLGRALLSTLAIAAVTGGPVYADCGDSETWAFDLETEGEDVFFTSPTAIGTDAARYLVGYEITLLEVDVSWMGIPFGPIDVTDEIPPELQSAEGIADGPLPITIFSGSIVFPEPPEDPAMAADVLIEIDKSGFGQLSLTNVELGDYELDLGPPFGTQTVTIEGVHIEGTVTVTELAPRTDLDGDCTVGFTDVLISLSSWGPCPKGDPCVADLNGDWVVGFSDFIPILVDWGEY